jgi:hypothetical protein
MKINIKLFLYLIPIGIFITLIVFLNSHKYDIIPTSDDRFPEGIYIPQNLNDCYNELDKMLNFYLKLEMLFTKEDNLSKYHLGLGMWIRNFWIRSKDKRLRNYFHDIGIYTPDDMSGIIIDSYWRKLHKKSINLDQQIKYYQDYWKEKINK